MLVKIDQNRLSHTKLKLNRMNLFKLISMPRQALAHSEFSVANSFTQSKLPKANCRSNFHSCQSEVVLVQHLHSLNRIHAEAVHMTFEWKMLYFDFEWVNLSRNINCLPIFIQAMRLTVQHRLVADSLTLSFCRQNVSLRIV